jgi:predicted nuclease of predicted toxin-antitoxin system
MRFIVDNQLPPALARWLIERGHEAKHVYSEGLGEADDTHIWSIALQQTAIVVTKDADFAERRATAGSGPTILWLRVGNTTTPNLFAILDTAWASIEDALGRDAVVEVR